MLPVRNAWYVACWENELEGAPLARKILGEPLVFFRDESGAPAALLDQCPHRGVPLSLGKVIGGELQCPYHGLRFDGEGTCVLNPHVPGKSRLRTSSRRVVARHGAVWIWGGDPQQADPAAIPDYGWFDADRDDYRVVRRLIHVRASFELIVDNLLDLSHAEYIHANTVGKAGASNHSTSDLESGEDFVTVFRKTRGIAPSAFWKSVWTRTALIDQESNMTWRPASNLLLDLAVMPPGEQRDAGYHFPSAHLLTPETEGSTHYFFALSRNFELDDEALSARIGETFARVFNEEDTPILEAAYARLLDGASDFRHADFTRGDIGARRARGILESMAAAEMVPERSQI